MNDSNIWQNEVRAAAAHLKSCDPLMGVIIDSTGPCTITPHADHYGALVDAIISQQLSVKAGDTIVQRFKTAVGGHMPTPKEIIHMEIESMRSLGVSYAKARYLQDLAEHILDGRLDMQHITSLPNEAVISELTAVKGIGEWTAHMFLIFSLGRLNVLPVGDLGIRKAVMKVYKLDALPDPTTIRTIARDNGWTPYESIASWYLWRSLDNNPIT